MIVMCPQCGFSRNVPEERLPQGSVIAKCPRCACRFRFSAKDGVGAIVPPGTSHPDGEVEDIRVTASNAYAAEQARFENEAKARAAMAAQEAARNPWATAPGQTGWLAAFYQTVIRVMFQAPQFFRSIQPVREIWRPLGFFLIICILQTVVERFWGKALLAFLMPDAQKDAELQHLLTLLNPETSLALAILLRSGVLLFQLFIFAVLMYLVYRILVPGRAAFSSLYQILAYSASPWLLCIIPGLGSLAGALWSVACIAIGCRTAFGLTWAQTLAGFLPVIALIAPLLMQAVEIINRGI